jgi:hypothetical protein
MVALVTGIGDSPLVIPSIVSAPQRGGRNKASPYNLEVPFYMGFLHIRSRH